MNSWKQDFEDYLRTDEEIRNKLLTFGVNVKKKKITPLLFTGDILPYLPGLADTPSRTKDDHKLAITNLMEKYKYCSEEHSREPGEPLLPVTNPYQIILLHILWGIEKDMPKPAMKKPPPLSFVDLRRKPPRHKHKQKRSNSDEKF